MILLLFVLVGVQAQYSSYPSIFHDPVEGTKGVGASLSVLEGKNGAVPMGIPQPLPSVPQPIPIDIIDSNTGRKIDTHNVVRIAPFGYQQPGPPQYSLQYLMFGGSPAPYGNNAIYREPYFMNYGYPMQPIQFPQYGLHSNGIYGRPAKKH